MLTTTLLKALSISSRGMTPGFSLRDWRMILRSIKLTSQMIEQNKAKWTMTALSIEFIKRKKSKRSKSTCQLRNSSLNHKTKVSSSLKNSEFKKTSKRTRPFTNVLYQWCKSTRRIQNHLVSILRKNLQTRSVFKNFIGSRRSSMELQITAKTRNRSKLYSPKLH